MNLFLDVAHEAFDAASLFSLSQEITFFAMRAFGGHDLSLMAVSAVGGGLLALALDWIVGRGLASLSKQVWFPRARYDRMAGPVRRYGPWLLLLACSPLGGILMLGAGFFRIPAPWALGVSLLSLIGFYGAMAL